MSDLVEIGVKILLKQNNKILRDFREIQSQRNLQERYRVVDSLESICTKFVTEDLWKLTKYPMNSKDETSWSYMPLDGKENFVSGSPLFGTYLFMQTDEKVQLALINLPATNNVFIIEAAKLFKTNQGGIHKIANANNLNSTIIATNIQIDLPYTRNFASNLISYIYACLGYVGGFVLEMDDSEARLVELITREAGGRFSRIGKLSVGSGEIIHDALRKIVLEKDLSKNTSQEKLFISFCCGPTSKPNFWSSDIYNEALMAESHCSARGKQKVRQVQTLLREVLEIPRDYKVLLMNGSATGAVESAFFNLLGHNNIQSVSYDVFGRRWSDEIEIMINNLKKYTKNYPFLDKINYNINEKEFFNETKFDPKSDLVLVYTGTSSGHVWDKNLLIRLKQAQDKGRVVIADITSAVFIEEKIPWEAIDAGAFSFQKGLGCEAGLGCLVLSPNACNLVKNREQIFLSPRIFRLSEELIIKNDTEGEIRNTISMLNLHEIYHALKNYIALGGLEYMTKQAQKNQRVILNAMPEEMVSITPEWCRSKSLLCAQPEDPNLRNWEFVKKIELLAEKNGVIGISGHPLEIPSWRFWTGPSMNEIQVQTGFKRFLNALKIGIR